MCCVSTCCSRLLAFLLLPDCLIHEVFDVILHSLLMFRTKLGSRILHAPGLVVTSDKLFGHLFRQTLEIVLLELLAVVRSYGQDVRRKL